MKLNDVVAECSVELESVAEEARALQRKEKRERAIKAISDAQSYLDNQKMNFVRHIRSFDHECCRLKKSIQVMDLNKLEQLKKINPQEYSTVYAILKRGGVEI